MDDNQLPAVKLDIKQELLQNKKYNLLALSYGKAKSIINQTYPTYSLSSFKKDLKDKFHMSAYTIKTTLRTLEELHIISIVDNDIYFSDVSDSHILIDIATILYYATLLSDNAFKIFCILYLKFAQNDKYFSYIELLRDIGFQKNQANMTQLKMILQGLIDFGIIDFSESKYVKGRKGKYHELLCVNTYVELQNQRQVKKKPIEVIENNVEEEKTLPLAIDWNHFLAENLEKFKDDAWLFFCNDKEKACEFWDETCKGTIILPHEWNDLGVYVQNYRHERYK